MHVGDKWKILSGLDKGETFYDCSEHYSEMAIFEHPIDLHYVCANISGWPKLYAEVWGVDVHGRHSIKGYSCLTMPTHPGEYELECMMWRPQGSFFDNLNSFFLGCNPEILYKNMVLSGNDRFGMQCLSTGILHLRIGIIIKDFNLHGVMM
jgi:B9 domain-containing protein 2